MRVQGNEDGSFVFIFSPEEKKLGIQILKSFVCASEEQKQAIAVALQEILFAGMETPKGIN